MLGTYLWTLFTIGVFLHAECKSDKKVRMLIPVMWGLVDLGTEARKNSTSNGPQSSPARNLCADSNFRAGLNIDGKHLTQGISQLKYCPSCCENG